MAVTQGVSVQITPVTPKAEQARRLERVRQALDTLDAPIPMVECKPPYMPGVKVRGPKRVEQPVMPVVSSVDEFLDAHFMGRDAFRRDWGKVVGISHYCETPDDPEAIGMIGADRTPASYVRAAEAAKVKREKELFPGQNRAVPGTCKVEVAPRVWRRP